MNCALHECVSTNFRLGVIGSTTGTYLQKMVRTKWESSSTNNCFNV